MYADFMIQNGVLTGYASEDMEVVVPEGVTKITNSAFASSPITAISLPSTLVELDEFAFSECGRLGSVRFNSDEVKMGAYAFMNCSNLAYVDFPRYLSEVPHRAFFGCYRLERILLPDSVVSIDSSAFYGCDGLVEVILSEGLRSIGDEAFSFCGKLKAIDIPESVKTIGTKAFLTCRSLECITLPQGIESIGSKAFYNLPLNAVIRGKKGTLAHSYANEYGIGFIDIDTNRSPDTDGVYFSKDGRLLENCYMRVVSHHDCYAQSDNGIEEHTSGMLYYRIPAPYAIIEGGRITGVFFMDHRFMFDDLSTNYYELVDDRGYVGGWGNITDTEEYQVFIGKPPVNEESVSILPLL